MIPEPCLGDAKEAFFFTNRAISCIFLRYVPFIELCLTLCKNFANIVGIKLLFGKRLKVITYTLPENIFALTVGIKVIGRS